MRTALAFSIVLLLHASAGSEDDEAKPPKPPPIVGVHWEPDFQAGVQRAEQEGRPLLFAINALENERANNQLAAYDYRSERWGRASRGYVCFVANNETHSAADPSGLGPCSRYPGIPCAAHQASMGWLTLRFGNSLISPQHVIVEPDGDVAFRKEYYTGVVGPGLLERYLARLAPRSAYVRAGLDRKQQIDALLAAEAEALESKARTWVDSGDGFAVVGVLNVLDETDDSARRAALIRSLAAAHAIQYPVLEYGANEAVYFPDDAPEETLAWVETLFAASRTSGIWAAARAIARSEDADLRSRMLALWAGTAEARVDDVRQAEQIYATEALLLAGDRRGNEATPPEPNAEMARRIARAHAEPMWPTLDRALKSGRPAEVRGALLEADEATVRAEAARVVALLDPVNPERVRIAAALALLGRGVPSPRTRVVETLMAVLWDVVEGPDTRTQVLARLGADPGLAEAAWREALNAALPEEPK